jgi:cell pole-organizing protein PopZ
MTAGPDKDPSMEEILASIKRIITEDEAPPGTLDVPEPPAVDERSFATGDGEDVLELTDPLPEPPPVPRPKAQALVSERTEAAASQSLSTLSALIVRNYEGSENTLEGLVREMLKPMLREWLDANLPEIVESTVAREIARLTRRD